MSLLPSLLTERTSLRVASGKTGRCLYAPDGADWTIRLLESPLTGTFNLVNDGDTSWEAFARACLHGLSAAGLQPACREIVHIPYTELGPNWAKRPRHSSLDIGKLRQCMPPGPRHWREALHDFIATEKSFAAPVAL
jgi:dTDP-4-dehydrorhamnose reductase